jgi:hypothetical protein
MSWNAYLSGEIGMDWQKTLKALLLSLALIIMDKKCADGRLIFCRGCRDLCIWKKRQYLIHVPDYLFLCTPVFFGVY